MKDAGDAGVSVVAIANPGSGPGTEADRGPYEKGMQALRDSGVEVRVCLFILVKNVLFLSAHDTHFHHGTCNPGLICIG